MKNIKLFTLLVCVSALFATGCSSTRCEKKGECSAHKPSCGHQCCADAHTDCAHCPKCTHK